MIGSGGPISMTGAGGVLQATVSRVRSIALGSATVEGLAVVVSHFLAPLGEAVGVRLDGVLGYNFLRRFRVTFDYPAGMLSLVKAE